MLSKKHEFINSIVENVGEVIRTLVRRKIVPHISISDLYSSDSQALLAGVDSEDEDLICSAVNRALEARGGLSIPATSVKLCPPILVGIIYNPNVGKALL